MMPVYDVVWIVQTDRKACRVLDICTLSMPVASELITFYSQSKRENKIKNKKKQNSLLPALILIQAVVII